MYFSLEYIVNIYNFNYFFVLLNHFVFELDVKYDCTSIVNNNYIYDFGVNSYTFCSIILINIYTIYIYLYEFILYIYNENLLLYEIEFFTQVFSFETSIFSSLFFKPLQSRIYTTNMNTNLIFFRIYNPNTYTIKIFTTYTIYPIFFSVFFVKLQCFCFEELVIKPFESIDLPVLFFIDNSYSINNTIQKIVLLYNLFYFI